MDKHSQVDYPLLNAIKNEIDSIKWIIIAVTTILIDHGLIVGLSTSLLWLSVQLGRPQLPMIRAIENRLPTLIKINHNRL